MRYFLVFYSYSGWDKKTFACTGDGCVSILTNGNCFLNFKQTERSIAEKAGIDTTRKYVVILNNIIELSKQDYLDFTGDKE